MTQLGRTRAPALGLMLLWVGCVKPSFDGPDDAAQRTSDDASISAQHDATLKDDAALSDPPRDAAADARVAPGEPDASGPATPEQPTGSLSPCIVGVSKLGECAL